MKTSLYQRYLVADQITKRIEKVGAQSIYVMLDNTGGVQLSVMYDDEGSYLLDAQREEKVAAFLAAYPDASLDRQDDGYRPKMKVSGTAAHGIIWEIDFGTGVCERVQVGTKKVKTYDPEALAAIEMVEVEEPVFEYRCPDPILAAGLT